MSHNGQRGEPAWIASGEVVPLMLNSDFVRLGYGLELKQIPFSVALKNFEVPRDEGTDTPSDFRATLESQKRRSNQRPRSDEPPSLLSGRAIREHYRVELQILAGRMESAGSKGNHPTGAL